MTLDTLDPWGQFALVALAIIVVAQLAHRLFRPVLRRLAAYSPVLGAMLKRCDRPLQWLIPLVAINLALQGMPAELRGVGTAQHFVGVLTIIAVTWTLTRAIRGMADGVISLHPSTVADNLTARRIETQTRVLSRIASGTVLVAGLAFVLMTFPTARQLGTSLLASAGVAGLVVGLAARSVFTNLLAGLQIALAQPIRIDDVLIIEGEWGRVEEITATYVVLKIWDERRLIIPLGWFMEHPFQNWTRSGSQLLGTVFLWVDYTLPLEPIRAEARRLCEASANWDKRLCQVAVTDATERTMQLRVLVSAIDSGKAFDLRCELREGLIAFIQREHPQSLPRLRAGLEAAAAAA
ncbi:MAG: mechanosensitive ion channel [Rhizobacter sp.]|nr:mechanosensitive ion channel [Rhizobacter sp.]